MICFTKTSNIEKSSIKLAFVSHFHSVYETLLSEIVRLNISLSTNNVLLEKDGEDHLDRSCEK